MTSGKTASMVTSSVDSPARRKVCDAAARRLMEQGYAATTLRQIAEDAGIKAGSIYHHFASKEELFVDVFRQGIVVMIDAFQDPDTPADQPVLGHVRAHLGALFEHGPYTASHVTAFFTAPPSVRTAVVPARDQYEGLWNTMLAEQLRHLRDKDVALHRLILFGAMNTTIEWFDVSGNLTLDELAGAITRQFLHGVASQEVNPRKVTPQKVTPQKVKQ